MVIYWSIFSLFALAAILAGVHYQRLTRRQEMELQQLKQELRTLNNTLSALCKSGAGMDRRLGELERQGRETRERIITSEETRRADQPYGEAIQLVHQGASAQELVRRLGISLAEAELLCRVHGSRPAA